MEVGVVVKNLIIAPHPDDEVLGCGGFLAKYGTGSRVAFIVLGAHSHADGSMTYEYQRKKEIALSSKLFGFSYEIFMESKTWHCNLDKFPQEKLIIYFETLFNETKPINLFIPWDRGFNQDHRAVSTACLTALRPLPTRYYVPNVYYYDEPGHWSLQEVQFSPNKFLPLNKKEMSKKIAGVKQHKTQLRKYPNLRSIDIIKTTAELRGAQITQRYAEGYRIVREIGFK